MTTATAAPTPRRSRPRSASSRAQRNAVILAHNYERPEVQDVADYVGDSLGLSQQAAATDADVIVFCGVHFMAETAAILSPQKTVLLPDLGAGCSLADTIDAAQLVAWKAQHPGAVVVSYVNTTAEVKAESDYCCTSGNARKVIIDAIPDDREILFLPDMFLGLWLERETGRRMTLWPGECHVHAGIRPADIAAIRERHPGAPLLVHPECGCASQCMTMAADGELSDVQILSTEGMVRFAKERQLKQAVIATETGIIHRLKKELPDTEFVAVSEQAICRFMKLTTLEKVRTALAEDQHRIEVPAEVADRARGAILRMLELV